MWLHADKTEHQQKHAGHILIQLSLPYTFRYIKSLDQGDACLMKRHTHIINTHITVKLSGCSHNRKSVHHHRVLIIIVSEK